MYKRNSSRISTQAKGHGHEHTHGHSEYRSSNPLLSKLTRDLSSEEI